MNRYPETRFVRLRSSAPDLPSFSVTLLAANPAATPTVANHGVLAKIAEQDPERARFIRERVDELIGHNDRFFTWLAESPGNMQLFIDDPVAGVRQALSDLPPHFFADWGSLER